MSILLLFFLWLLTFDWVLIIFCLNFDCLRWLCFIVYWLLFYDCFLLSFDDCFCLSFDCLWWLCLIVMMIIDCFWWLFFIEFWLSLMIVFESYDDCWYYIFLLFILNVYFCGCKIVSCNAYFTWKSMFLGLVIDYHRTSPYNRIQ